MHGIRQHRDWACRQNYLCISPQVTYKLLIQHWFAKCSEYENENDRLLGIDSIPPSIRRANPNLTRDFYLKHRSQVSYIPHLGSSGR